MNLVQPATLVKAVSTSSKSPTGLFRCVVSPFSYAGPSRLRHPVLQVRQAIATTVWLWLSLSAKTGIAGPLAGEVIDRIPNAQRGDDWLATLLGIVWLCLFSLAMAVVYFHRRQAGRRETVEIDDLTKLKNRNYLHRHFSELAVDPERGGAGLHLAVIDLDGFRLVNDTLGHQAGDTVLVIAARRIEQCVRKQDLVARIGADEFIVVLAGAKENAVEETMQRIIATLQMPMRVGQELTTVTASIGLARHAGGQHLETLLLHADTALFYAKKQGRNLWKQFSPQMDGTRIAAAEIHRRLRSALQHDELILMYQPKWACGTRRLIGVEALVRWNDPQKGVRLPGEFIGIAERTGLIGALGNWVMREACSQVRRWREHGWDVPVAVNVSALQVSGPEMASCIRDVIRESNIPPHALTLEITESVAVEDPLKTMQVFEALREMGIAISIDDFGTGYSSLAYLKRFPATELKIDRAFVDDIARNRQSLELVRAMIAMGHALDMKVVAEGVENESTATLLEMLNCDILQGNHLSVPVHPDEIPRLMSMAS